MINARDELIKALDGKKPLCAWLRPPRKAGSNTPENLRLVAKYTKQDFSDFLAVLDFEYNNGFGGQLLHGVVWLENGEWLERGEYDGSEWWELKSCPLSQTH